MIYRKPEVAMLGNATAVIEITRKGLPWGDPVPPRNADPAYDMDE